MSTKAVILAAGSGERLIKEGLSVPKPLISVGGLSTVERTIRTAFKAGVTECIVVLGAKADVIKAAVAPRLERFPVRWVTNLAWESGNGSSVLAARPFIQPGDHFVILMADHLIFASTLRTFINSAKHAPGCVMAVDYKKGLLIDPDDATKVRVSGAQIMELGKQLSPFDAIDTGVSMCTTAIFDAVEEGAKATPGNVSHTGGMRVMAAKGHLAWHDIGSDRWEDVDSLGAHKAAEDLLFQSLRKSTDGMMSRLLERRISLAVTRFLMKTPVTPNMLTIWMMIIGAIAACFFAQPGWTPKMIGAVLFWLTSCLDGCDGELARLKFLESRLGGWLDLWSDNFVHMLVFIGMGVGLTRDTGDLHWSLVGAIAAAGVFISVSWVSITMLQKHKRNNANGPLFTTVASDEAQESRKPSVKLLTRWADALSRRDFIFFTMFLTAFGLLPYFLWAAAIGSHIYWIVLLAIAVMSRSHTARAEVTYR